MPSHLKQDPHPSLEWSSLFFPLEGSSTPTQQRCKLLFKISQNFKNGLLRAVAGSCCSARGKHKALLDAQLALQTAAQINEHTEKQQTTLTQLTADYKPMQQITSPWNMDRTLAISFCLLFSQHLTRICNRWKWFHTEQHTLHVRQSADLITNILDLLKQ